MKCKVKFGEQKRRKKKKQKVQPKKKGEPTKKELSKMTSSELRQMMSNEEKGGVSKQSGERSMVVPEITSVFKVKMTIQHLDGSWYFIC